jgi:hypothetical protein
MYRILEQHLGTLQAMKLMSCGDGEMGDGEIGRWEMGRWEMGSRRGIPGRLTSFLPNITRVSTFVIPHSDFSPSTATSTTSHAALTTLTVLTLSLLC